MKPTAPTDRKAPLLPAFCFLGGPSAASCEAIALTVAGRGASRGSAALGLRSSSGVAADDPVVQVIGQSVNAVVATLPLAYLASVASCSAASFDAVRRVARAPAPESNVVLRRPRLQLVPGAIHALF